MLHHLQIFSFTLKHLIRILARLEHARSASLGIHLGHLLRHLARSCQVNVLLAQAKDKGPSSSWADCTITKIDEGGGDYVPFSSPSMKIKTDCSPKRFRKYHDRLDTHRTSRSRVATPDCSIDLNRIVNGKGSFTSDLLVSTLQPAAIYAHMTDGDPKLRI